MVHIGFDPQTVNWIEECYTSASCAVLKNGPPTHFSKPERGLRQGCLLSPLLFLLVGEGLGKIMKRLNAKGKFKGVQGAPDLNISHLLFVDMYFSLGGNSSRQRQ
jgi:hypothetical protein